MPVLEVVEFGYFTPNSPEFGNPIVESTSITVDPEETFPIIWVFGATLKLPLVALRALESLLYPPSNANL